MNGQPIYILFFMFVASQAKNEELPLCPTDIQYFPQNIPMHCRMPNGADFASLRQNVPTVVPPSAPLMSYQSPPPNKQPNPIPIPFPGVMPGQMPIALPGPMPGMMPLPGPGPAHKLPVIVMPFYAPDTSYKKPEQERPDKPKKRRVPKKRRPRPQYSDDDSSDTDTDTDSSDTDTSTSDDSTGRDYWKGVKKDWKKNARNSRRSFRRKNKKKALLTPVLQYVTRDGYVIFEKTITKNEASDWLNVKKKTEAEKKKDADAEPYDQHNHDDDHEHDDHDHDDHENDDERRLVEKEQSSVVRNKKHVHSIRPNLNRNSELNKGLKKT